MGYGKERECKCCRRLRLIMARGLCSPCFEHAKKSGALDRYPTAKKPADPVNQFLARIQAKHRLAVAKYPPEYWAQMTDIAMLHALEDELDELKTALWGDDLEGPHGIMAEAVDVANVAMRIALEMQRRKKTLAVCKAVSLED